MSAAYLEKLKQEQRRAVEHGLRENDAVPGAPHFVIAGAGFGKTKTVAHRVAHLSVNGADPRKIHLMTLSRRATAEMARRAARLHPWPENPQGDRHVYASPTRFIPAALLGLFEQTAWPMVALRPAARPANQGVRVDVGARMRGMWR